MRASGETDAALPVSLKVRTIRAAAWSFSGDAISQVLRFASNLILTRLLVPEMFGVMAVAYTIITTFNLLSDLGIRQVIIQNQREDAKFVNTVWTIMLIRATVVWVGTLFLALAMHQAGKAGWLPEGSTLAEPILPQLIAVISFGTLIIGFQSTRMTTANRKLSLHRLTLVNLFSQAIGIIVMVVWAFIDKSVWALAAGAIISNIIMVILSHVMFDGVTNRLCWESCTVKTVITFGKWILLSTALTAVISSADRLILGSLLSSNALGVYSIALMLVMAVRDVLSRITGSVALPALSEIVRNQRSELSIVYYKFRYYFDLLAYFAFGILFYFGQEMVKFFYDERYENAGFILKWMSFILLTVPYSLSDQVYTALGYTRLVFIVKSAHASILLVGMYGLYSVLGPDLAFLAVPVSYIAVVPVWILMNTWLGLFDSRKELRSLLYFLCTLSLGLLAKMAFS